MTTHRYYHYHTTIEHHHTTKTRYELRHVTTTKQTGHTLTQIVWPNGGYWTVMPTQWQPAHINQ